MTKVMLTVKEAAEIANIGRDRMYEMVARGIIPHVRIGRRVLVHHEALLNWLREQSEQRAAIEV